MQTAFSGGEDDPAWWRPAGRGSDSFAAMTTAASPVRVRFAPSPTGWLHVGGARTAYFNWLFARQHGGRSVLRVEDTDVARSSPESEGGVLEDLRWLGLDHDEGPDVGGPHGPYRQSERLALYRERAEVLVAQRAAYPCFCTDAELEARRAAALARGEPPHYDGRCRALSQAEREEARRQGRPESLRFVVEPRDWTLHDLVRGEVRFPARMVGDFVLLRSSGLPTYNFACVVDDHAMRISHVIRAEEHLPNTVRQLMLYQGLGVEPPAFAHVPLILNADRSKMSKRAGEVAVAVGDWRQAGYVPEALLSYLALLGFHPGDDREVLSRSELFQAFTLERVGKSGSVFDPDKLRWVNAQVLHGATGAELRRWVAAAAAPGRAEPQWRAELRALTAALEPARIEQLLEFVRRNVGTLAELVAEVAAVLHAAPDDEARAVLADIQAAEVCEAMAEILDGLAEWNPEALKSALHAVGTRLGIRGKPLFQPVRAALTGRLHGPELPSLATVLDRETCAARLRRAATGQPVAGKEDA
jgi:nondiscriminating glutamyl-tRNA synthetase